MLKLWVGIKALKRYRQEKLLDDSKVQIRLSKNLEEMKTSSRLETIRIASQS